MIYIVYWKNDYKRALNSLCKHAVCGQIRYVTVSKPHLLPGVLKRFEVGLSGNLLAVCVSSVVYTEDSWKSVFGDDHSIESISLMDDLSEQQFNEWFDSHISPFSRKVRGGVVRHVVRDPTEEEVARRRQRDKDIAQDFISEMREMYREQTDRVLEMCLREVGTEYGNWLADKQDEFLIMNAGMMGRWARLTYFEKKGLLKERGKQSLSLIRKRISDFMSDYIKLFYDTEREWDQKFYKLWIAKREEYAEKNEIDIGFLVPSKPVQLSTFRSWLEEEYPKIRPGYFVLPIWFHEQLVEQTLLSRVMPYEQHLRNLSYMSPKPRPQVVFVPPRH